MLFLAFLVIVSAECPPNYFYEVSRDDCVSCAEVCYQCTGEASDDSTNCLVCNDPMQVVVNGNCFYPCEITDNCSVCSLSCKNCAETQCLECFSPYILLVPSCTLSCPSGFYASDSECLKCDLSCNECTNSGNTNCISCDSNYIFYQNTCVIPFCGDGLISSNEQCDDAIDENCLNCEILNCEHGFYQNPTQCLPCDISCNGCSEKTNADCDKCNDSFIMYLGTCVIPFCGDGQRSKIEECDDGIDQNCKNCLWTACSSGQYLRDGKCLPCDSSCNECIGEFNTDCLQCSNGYVGYQGICVVPFCGDGVLTAGEECDDGLDQNCVNCIVAQCVPPVLITSKYIENYSALQIEFDVSLGQVTCSVFSSQDLFGTDPACFTASTAIIVQFGSFPKLNFESVLSIKEKTLNSCSPHYKITAAEPNPNFALTISGSDYIGTCSPFLSLSVLSKSNYGRDLHSFSWSLNPPSPSIQIYLTSLNPLIPTDLLLGSIYSFQVSALDFLGNPTNASHLVNSTLQNAPIITDPIVTQIHSQNVFYIRTDATICNNSHQIFFDWEVTSNAKVPIEKFGRILMVQQGSLDVGDKIVIRVWAWTWDSVKTYRDLHLEYVQADIQALIYPRCVSTRNNSFEFDGRKSSYSGSNAGIDYKWELLYNDLVVFTGTLETFQLPYVDKGLYQLRLVVSKFNAVAVDLIEVRVGESESFTTASSVKLQTDEFVMFSKSDTKAVWKSNLRTLSDYHKDHVRFFSDGTQSTGWVSLNSKCKETITLSALPSNGSFKITPQSGIAWDTQFKLQADNWENAYFYQFWYSTGQEFVPFTDKIFQSHFSTFLPFSTNLSVKLRLYTMFGSYIDRIIRVSIIVNKNTPSSIFLEVLNSVPLMYYEKILQNAVLLLPVLEKIEANDEQCFCNHGVCENSKCICNQGYSGEFCLDPSDELELFHSKLLNTIVLSKKYLPSNEYIDLMALQALSKLFKIKQYLTTEKVGTGLEIIKTIDSYWNNRQTAQSILDISSAILDFPSVQENKLALQSEIEKILVAIGQSFSKTLSEEPPFTLSSNKISLQALHLYSDFSSQVIKVSAISPIHLTIINFSFNPLSSANNSISENVILIDIFPNITVQGEVSIPDLLNSSSLSCVSSINKTFTANKKNELFWCDFSKSQKIYLEQSEITGTNFKYFRLLWILLGILLNTVWIIWAAWKDNKDKEMLDGFVTLSDSLGKALKNCHCVSSIFVRYDCYVPRVYRIFIINVKLSIVCTSVIILQEKLEKYFIVCIAVTCSFAIGAILRIFLKKKKKGTEKVAQEDPPVYRYSPSIKIPEIGERVRYTHVRSQSEANNEIANISVIPNKFLNCVSGVLAWTSGFMIIAYCLRLTILSDLHWGLFCISFGFDFIFFQCVSVALQYYLLRHNKFFSRFVSKTIRELTETSVIING